MSGKLDLELEIDCPRCGRYQLTGSMHAMLMKNPLVRRGRANASGWLREHSGARLTEYDYDWFTGIRTPPLARRGESLLRYLTHRWQRAGEEFKIDFQDPAYEAAAWAEDTNDAYFTAWSYLGHELAFLDMPDGQGNRTWITPKAWLFLDSLEVNRESPYGFIAMSFHPTMQPVRAVIREAILAAEYDHLAVDEKRHEELIDSEIIAGIRRSRFVVVDYTRQSRGAYFEAGYGLGLGLKVIRTCDKAEERDIHFDQNHYNILFWTGDSLPDFTRELTHRIVEAVGPGPIRTSTLKPAPGEV